MFKTTKEYDAAVSSVLKALLNGGKWNEKPEAMDKTDFDDVLSHIMHFGYAIGFSGTRDTAGDLTLKLVKPRITRDGLSFIEQPSQV